MTEFVTCRLRCPVCSTEFSADEVHGAPVVGRDTDLRPLYEGPGPLLTHMHSCPGCRYSGYREAFETEPTDEDELIEEVVEEEASLPRPAVSVPDESDADDLRRYLRSGELAEGLVSEGTEPFGAVRYLLAARLHEYLNENDPLGCAHYYLRAVWSARATGDAALELDCLRELLLRLSNVLESEHLVEAERARLAYLTAEVARRAGDFGRALELFAQVELDADPDEEEGYMLSTLARRQALLAGAKSDVNAVIPAELQGRTRRSAAEEDGMVADDEEDGGPGTLN